MKALKLLSVSLAALALVACESSEDKAVRFAENAQDYLDEGELQRARLQFQNALQNDPNNLVALRGAAEVAEREERLTDQLRFLERIVTLEPDDIEAVAKISRLNLLGGRPEEALRSANRVLEAQPDNLDALTVKGAALVLQNNLDGASEVLEQALSQAPDNAEVRNLMAARYVRDEDFERAQQVINEGLETDPNNEALLVVKLLLAQRRQDPIGMGETFRTLIDVSPENGFYKERYGEFLILARRDLDGAREQFEAALPLLAEKTPVVGRLIGIIREQEGDEVAEARLRELVTQFPDEDLVFAIAAFLCEVGQEERCEAEFQSIADNSDQSIENRSRASVQLGERTFQARDFEKAREIAEGVLSEDETNPEALTLLGKIQLTENDSEGAIETLRLALNEEPDQEAALILLGLAYEANGRTTFGEAQLSQAIDRLGLSSQLFNAYRGMLVRNGKAEEAADLTLRFAQTANATPQVQRESAAVLISQNRSEEAEVVARSLIRVNPDDQAARRVLATALLQQERFDEAIAALDDLSEEGADNAASVQLRTEILNRQGRTDELRTYLQGVVGEGEIFEAFGLLVQLEANAGNAAEAASIAQSAVETFPQVENSYVLVYNTQIAQQNANAANATLDEGIATATTTGTLRTLKANRLLAENDRVGARDVLKSLYDDDQLNDLAANNLAALMLDLGDDPAVALEIAKRFEGTEQPFLADTLAWAYFKNDQLQEAVRYSNIAKELDQDIAEILFHIGTIAAANGDVETARDAFERALEAPGKTEAASEEAIREGLASL